MFPLRRARSGVVVIRVPLFRREFFPLVFGRDPSNGHPVRFFPRGRFTVVVVPKDAVRVAVGGHVPSRWQILAGVVAAPFPAFPACNGATRGHVGEVGVVHAVERVVRGGWVPGRFIGDGVVVVRPLALCACFSPILTNALAFFVR